MTTFNAKEYKVVALRECPLPESMCLCDTPQGAAEYWRQLVTQHPAFNPEVECLVVLLLNTRRRVKGHALVSTGTLDTLLVHPREVFRTAVGHQQPPSSLCTTTRAAKLRPAMRTSKSPGT